MTDASPDFSSRPSPPMPRARIARCRPSAAPTANSAQPPACLCPCGRPERGAGWRPRLDAIAKSPSRRPQTRPGCPKAEAKPLAAAECLAGNHGHQRHGRLRIGEHNSSQFEAILCPARQHIDRARQPRHPGSGLWLTNDHPSFRRGLAVIFDNDTTAAEGMAVWKDDAHQATCSTARVPAGSGLISDFAETSGSSQSAQASRPRMTICRS